MILASAPALGIMCSNCGKVIAVISADSLQTRNIIRDFLERRRAYALCPECALWEKDEDGEEEDG